MATNTNPDSNKALTPFTYEHFVQAIHSLKDNMLMCYIDQAIGIYCNLRGITVGQRPDHANEYSNKYADAYEMANYAIYIVSNKIGSFDSSKGNFKSYLNTALANALKDILKENGAGDFFDQTSKKKNKDEEPEKHIKVDIDQFWGATDRSVTDPDNEDEEKEIMKRRHLDDALEVMIKYIDGLPDIEREAIYASAFGQAIRPELESLGRNYADIIAERYGKSAEYIRKLASRGKRKALDKVYDSGFKPFIYDFLVTEKTPGECSPESTDKVLQAIDQLKPYQHFMLLRHLVETTDREEQPQKERERSIDHGSPWIKPFDRAMAGTMRKEDLARIDYSGRSLDIELRHKLNSVICDRPQCHHNHFDKCGFRLGEYSSLLEMLDQLNIGICTMPGIEYHSIPPELNEAEEYWEKEVERLHEMPGDKAEYQDALQKLEEIRKEKKNWSQMILRGCYLRKEKRILLYPDAMEMECGGKIIDALVVSTLLHEIMHAYFDRTGRENLPYLPFIEEPLAEFGMLLYLKETDKLKNFPDGPNEWYDWAYQDVKQKSTCYRLGAYLMDRYTQEGLNSNLRHILEEYKTFNTKLIPPALMWWK